MPFFTDLRKNESPPKKRKYHPINSVPGSKCVLFTLNRSFRPDLHRARPVSVLMPQRETGSVVIHYTTQRYKTHEYIPNTSDLACNEPQSTRGRRTICKPAYQTICNMEGTAVYLVAIFNVSLLFCPSRIWTSINDEMS